MPKLDITASDISGEIERITNNSRTKKVKGGMPDDLEKYVGATTPLIGRVERKLN